jgi:hypothetical protein
VNFAEKESFKQAFPSTILTHFATVTTKIHIQQATKAQRRSKGIALLFLQPWRYMWWVVNATPRPLYLQEIDPVPIVQKAKWAPWPVWTGAENLAPIWTRSPGSPVILTELSWSPKYKVVQIWPGQTVTCLHTISPGHIWTTLYLEAPLQVWSCSFHGDDADAVSETSVDLNHLTMLSVRDFIQLQNYLPSHLHLGLPCAHLA